MNKRVRKIIERAAEYIGADAEMAYRSNKDSDGYVDSRDAWRSIKDARKLAKQLAALARAEGK